MEWQYYNHESQCAAARNSGRVICRRAFLKASVGLAGGPALSQLSCALRTASKRGRGAARFGIVSDCHYADADTVGSRYYRQSLDKLGECVEVMNAERVDFLIELGDFKDEDRPAVEEKTISHLQAVEGVFEKFKGPRHHVLGNHDEDSISKRQFLASVENTGIDAGKTYYSFDFKGAHFVVLDANYRADGADYDHGNFNWTDANIPPAELEWLKDDLERAHGPAIVFVHQLLDGSGAHYVRNAAEVRAVLQSSGQVPAVFQGHQHSGGYSQIEGIHYYTLKAVVEGPGEENNAYAVVEVRPDGDITITGYRKAETKHLTPRSYHISVHNRK